MWFSIFIACVVVRMFIVIIGKVNKYVTTYLFIITMNM